MSTLTEAAAACCACIRVRWVTTPDPDGTVSERWVCSACEREFEPRAVAYSRGVEEGTRAMKSAVLYTVGGTVEGHPTSAINYLQRLRQLVRIEKAARQISDWHAVSGNAGYVSADDLDALCDALGDGPITDEPYVVSLRADFERLTRENAKYRADFARDQAELASQRITLAEAKKDLEQAAKVTSELVDGLSEETRRRNVAEVEVEAERRDGLTVAEGEALRAKLSEKTHVAAAALRERDEYRAEVERLRALVESFEMAEAEAEER